MQTTQSDVVFKKLRTPTLADAIDTFFRLELGVKERAASTLEWYRYRLETMSAFIGADTSPSTVMDIDLLEFMATLKDRNTLYGNQSSRPEEIGKLSPATIRGYVRAMRRFWAWMYKRKFIEDNPASELPMPTKPKIARRGITDADQDAMLSASRPTWDHGPVTDQDRKAFRDYALLCFLDSTGCRLGGLAHLTLTDLNIHHPDRDIRRRAYVIEKGNKGRYVFMNDRTIAAMQAWLYVRPPCATDHVFVGRGNGKAIWKDLAEGGVYSAVRTYAVIAGVIAKKALWSPHQWRHRFGRRWLERGGDLSRLAQLLGHSTVQITSEFYGQLEIDALQDGYARIMGY